MQLILIIHILKLKSVPALHLREAPLAVSDVNRAVGYCKTGN